MAEVVHIAIAPPAKLDPNLVNGVAAVIDKSPAHAQLLLASKLPRIIAHADNALLAETMVKELGKLGLKAIACSDSELCRLPDTFPVQTLEFGKKEVNFRDSAGGEISLAAGDIFLIVTGRIESSLEIKTTRSRGKFSWGRTLMLGGAPAWKTVRETTTEKSGQTEDFARLYSRQADQPVVELLQHELTYTCLGDERAVSSVANFEKMLRRLREAFPKAVFDDRLHTSLALTEWEDVELNCRLIHLFRTMAK
ncbi:MAG: hypothetical protein PVJ61_00060 [Dehalococcoidia bacterium]|jgi:hypothetical protein